MAPSSTVDEGQGRVQRPWLKPAPAAPLRSGPAAASTPTRGATAVPPANVTPNLVDYEAAAAEFLWDDAWGELSDQSGQTLNIAHEAVDRHVAEGRGDQVAIRWLPKRGEPVDLTYSALAERMARFHGVLGGLGLGPGTRVASIAGRLPDLYVAALGTLRAGGVFSPLFAAFGPEPIRQRLDLGKIEAVVTTPNLYRRRLAALRAELPALRHVLLIGTEGEADLDELTAEPGVQDLVALLERADADQPPAATGPDDPALLHFTSGTTGTPKGALHVHGAVVAHRHTARLVLDLHPGDIYWCTADPGWVTGTSYGIIGPLTNGVTSIIDEADFDADRWYGIIQDQGVTVWYTAPTAIRMLMRIGADVAGEYDLSSLRVMASVGEPLNPEAVVWGESAFGLSILDNWWQTETGGIMIANYRSVPVRPGSMGRPLPGIEAAILKRVDGELELDPDGHPVEAAADELGELALRAGWPSMFRAYLDMDERYASCFVDGWYRSGDLARRDADGYFWFVGRGDDVIKSAGHLIGPFEVESVLIEHPAVSEAGVIGKPDETSGAIVKAFVVLAPGLEDTPELKRELLSFARKRLGSVAAPREIEVPDQLPRTRSGKIMRRLLKARELGLPEGDLSTLETPS
ncbi:MAG: acetate--CoA ligase [Actinomycetia bacterium]|nr:acetate--CoA ligase [Actinomycetes bacterium]